MEVIHCNTSGIFIPKIQIGSFVRENQVLGCIVRPILGAELEEVKSSCDGMIFSLREYPAVCEGELLARICKAERPAGKRCAIFRCDGGFPALRLLQNHVFPPADP